MTLLPMVWMPNRLDSSPRKTISSRGWRKRSARLEPHERAETRHAPDAAVVVPALRHGVEVRSGRDRRRTGFRPLQPSDQIAPGVRPHRQAGLAHQPGEVVARRPVRIREHQTIEAPLPLAESSDPSESRLNPCLIHRRAPALPCATRSSLSLSPSPRQRDPTATADPVSSPRRCPCPCRRRPVVLYSGVVPPAAHERKPPCRAPSPRSTASSAR